MFKIGDKIICGQKCQRGLLTEGETYEITGIEGDSLNQWFTVWGLSEEQFPAWMFKAAPKPEYEPYDMFAGREQRFSVNQIIDGDKKRIARFETAELRYDYLEWMRGKVS